MIFEDVHVKCAQETGPAVIAGISVPQIHYSVAVNLIKY